MKIDSNGTVLPVEPRFYPVCTLDTSDIPVPLAPGGTLPANAATEARQDAQLNQAQAAYFASMGLYGSEFIGDTSAHTGDYFGLIAVTDTEIGSITLGASSSGGSALAGVLLSPGQQVLAHVTSITLASGVVQLIKAPTPFPA